MKYRMYIDECGTDDIVSCHLPLHRHLALTGVIMELGHTSAVATPGLDALKLKHFPGRDPDAEPLVLHRSHFLGTKGEFGRLADPALMAAFLGDLAALLTTIQHTVITVVIDKHAMLGKSHWRNKEPYHYCAEVLAEKFVQFLERKSATGDIFAESRKSDKNKRLQKAFDDVCTNGSQFVSDPKRYKDRLDTFKIEFREKKHNNTGIQIADIYAKPSMDRIRWHKDRQHPRSPFSKSMGSLLFNLKYDRSPRGQQWGYGMKSLPT